MHTERLKNLATFPGILRPPLPNFSIRSPGLRREREREKFIELSVCTDGRAESRPFGGALAFSYKTNGMHKYFRRCSSRRGGRIHRGDFRLRGELVSLITVSVHEYDCRATVARRGTEASVASPLVTPLMNLCICILQRGSRHPEQEEYEEEEGSSSCAVFGPRFLTLSGRAG